MKFKLYVIRKIRKENNMLFDEEIFHATGIKEAEEWFKMVAEANDTDMFKYELRTYYRRKTGRKILAVFGE